MYSVKKDVWAINDIVFRTGYMLTMVMVCYYDYSDPFGGAILYYVLLLDISIYIIPQTTSGRTGAEAQRKANDAYASAYSTMVGSGMDSLSSICIATSVKAIFQEIGTIDEAGRYSIAHHPTLGMLLI